jgi:hypothetical protein
MIETRQNHANKTFDQHVPGTGGGTASVFTSSIGAGDGSQELGGKVVDGRTGAA